MPTAATVLVSKFEQFSKESAGLIAQMYRERAEPEEIRVVMKGLSRLGRDMIEQAGKLQLLNKTALAFAPPKPLELPKYQWTFEHGECKKQHILFGNSEEEWLKFAEAWEKAHGEWPEVTDRKELDKTQKFEMIYGLGGFPVELMFKFEGTAEEFVRHSEKFDCVLIETSIV